MSIQKILTRVNDFREELAEVCSQLIQRPSAHPEGRTVECVKYIEDYFKELGIPTNVYKKTENKPNIVAHIKGVGEKKIAWIGHLDVVPEGKPENWTYPPYSGKITSDGNIWGRGSSDMKGACAAAMVAAKVLNECGNIPNSVDFWFTADEEVGAVNGALWLAQKGFFKGDVCIIGDGTPGTPLQPAIDLGCKGGSGTRLIARGKTSHGSRPFLGDNAIDKLLKVIPYVKKIGGFRLDVPKELEPVITSTIKYMMKEEFNQEQREAVKRLFHYPSVTLNILDGGIKTNVVPDYAEAYFDIRLTSGTNPERVRNRITQLLKDADIPGVSLEFPRSSKTAGYYESPDTLFATLLAEAVRKVTGIRPMFKLLTGGTDAIMIKKFLDVPCLGFGSSIEGQAHTPNEHNNIELLLMSSKVYSIFPLIYKDWKKMEM